MNWVTLDAPEGPLRLNTDGLIAVPSPEKGFAGDPKTSGRWLLRLYVYSGQLLIYDTPDNRAKLPMEDR